MFYFWLLTLASLLLIGGVMGFVGWLAREVPDEAEKKSTQSRMNPDQLRLLAYAIMVAICLVGALIELTIMLRES